MSAMAVRPNPVADRADVRSVDRPTNWLRAILLGTLVISIVHYVDNTVRYSDYTGGKEVLVARWMVPAGWVLFTGFGLAGYLYFRRARWSPAALCLAVCSVGGLIDPAHFRDVSPSDFDALQITFITLNFLIGGIALFAFAVWIAWRRAPG